MIIDAFNLFDNNTALTTTAVSSNTIDLGVARDVGIGEDMALKFFCFVTTALTGGTSVQLQLQGSPDNSSWTTYAESRAYVTANLTAGASLFPVDWPSIDGAGGTIPRYLRVNYVIVGTYGAGKVMSGLVLDRTQPITYAAGLTIAN